MSIENASTNPPWSQTLAKFITFLILSASFFGICCFIVSQNKFVPVAPIGSNQTYQPSSKAVLSTSEITQPSVTDQKVDVTSAGSEATPQAEQTVQLNTPKTDMVPQCNELYGCAGNPCLACRHASDAACPLIEDLPVNYACRTE